MQKTGHLTYPQIYIRFLRGGKLMQQLNVPAQGQNITHSSVLQDKIQKETNVYNIIEYARVVAMGAR